MYRQEALHILNVHLLTFFMIQFSFVIIKRMLDKYNLFYTLDREITLCNNYMPMDSGKWMIMCRQTLKFRKPQQSLRREAEKV